RHHGLLAQIRRLPSACSSRHAWGDNSPSLWTDFPGASQDAAHHRHDRKTDDDNAGARRSPRRTTQFLTRCRAARSRLAVILVIRMMATEAGSLKDHARSRRHQRGDSLCVPIREAHTAVRLRVADAAWFGRAVQAVMLLRNVDP